MIRLTLVFAIVLAVTLGGYRFAKSSSASANGRLAHVAKLGHPLPAVGPGVYWMGAHPAECSVSGVTSSPATVGVLDRVPKIQEVFYSRCDHTSGIEAISIASAKEPTDNPATRHPEIYRLRASGHEFTTIHVRRGSTWIQVQLIGPITKANALALFRDNEPRPAQDTASH